MLGRPVRVLLVPVRGVSCHHQKQVTIILTSVFEGMLASILRRGPLGTPAGGAFRLSFRGREAFEPSVGGESLRFRFPGPLLSSLGVA